MLKILLLTLASALMLVGCDNGDDNSNENTSSNATPETPTETQTTAKPVDTSSPQEIGYGKIEGGVYSNAYFKMSIDVPEGWAVQSEAAQEEMMRAGSDLIAGNNQNLKSILKASEKQSVSLFSFFKYEMGKPVPFNPSVIAVAEKVGTMPGIKRGSDYLFHVKNLLQSGQMNYSFPKETSTVDFSGVSFDMMEASLNAGTLTVYQEYYATRMNEEYVLGFIISYASDEQKSELKDIIDNLTFSK